MKTDLYIRQGAPTVSLAWAAFPQLLAFSNVSPSPLFAPPPLQIPL